jgi:hypothetical protein
MTVIAPQKNCLLYNRLVRPQMAIALVATPSFIHSLMIANVSCAGSNLAKLGDRDLGCHPAAIHVNSVCIGNHLIQSDHFP